MLTLREAWDKPAGWLSEGFVLLRIYTNDQATPTTKHRRRLSGADDQAAPSTHRDLFKPSQPRPTTLPEPISCSNPAPEPRSVVPIRSLLPVDPCISPLRLLRYLDNSYLENGRHTLSLQSSHIRGLFLSCHCSHRGRSERRLLLQRQYWF